jgi:hypothetical protein
MIGIERWLDVLSILVIAGIIGVFFFSMRKSGVRRRALSEKPALFLEFTGKQVSVRRQKSKILPSYREQTEARSLEVESPVAESILIRINRTLAGFEDTCLATTHDSLKVLGERAKRLRILMMETGRRTRVTAGRVLVALRTRFDASNRARVAGLLKRIFSSGVQERLTGIGQRVAGDRIARLSDLRRQLRSGHSWEQVMRRLRQSATDVLLYVDYRWYRLERSFQSRNKRFKAITSRLAKTPFKEHKVVRVLMKTRNDFTVPERLQTWVRETRSVILQRRQDLAAGSRRLQDGARAYIRRLSDNERPDSAQRESLESPRPVTSGFSERLAAEPVALSLTSSGTLRLKSRLEDERTVLATKSAGSMTAAAKGAPLLSQVSVRYVGAPPRRYGDPAESRQSKQAAK